jgi:hypothetical protein
VSGIHFPNTFGGSVGNPVGNLDLDVGNQREACREPSQEPVPDTRERRSLSLSGTPGDSEPQRRSGGGAVTGPTIPSTAGLASRSDPLIAALARYVEALHQRYPDGPDQMRREALDARANMRRMRKNTGGRAA